MRDKKIKTFRWITKALAILLTCSFAVSALTGCKKEEKLPENDLYNEMAGVDLSAEITPLVEKGKSEYKIVIPAEVSETEEYAASEMQKYVKQSTGVELPIVRDNTGVQLGQKLLCIGNTKFVSETELNTSNLNLDGFRIKTEEETLLIKGERDRGTLYGTYDFLEKFLGVRFISVDFEHVPQLEEIPLYEMDIVEIPDIQSRLHRGYGENSYTPSQLAKRRMTEEIPGGVSMSKYGGGYYEDWTNGVQAYDTIVPTHIYGEKHPEWYTKTGYNAGDAGGNQWELSNGLTDDGTLDETMEESLLKTAIENIKIRLLEKPTAIYVGLGQNDNLEYCRGDHCGGKCLRQRELFGGHSAHAIVFVNVIAREIESWLKSIGDTRDVKFVIYAYLNTEPAPDTTAPRADLAIPHEDVYVQLCPYLGYWYNAPLSDSEKNNKFTTLLQAWEKVTDRFSVFDYTSNFPQPLTWFPNVSVLQPNLQTYAKMGTLRLVSDCGAESTYQWLLEDYLLVRLMWNVNRDVNALISEFNSIFFGEKAGEIMDEFVGFNEAYFASVAIQNGTWQGAQCTQTGGWLHSTSTLSVDYLRNLQRYIDRAKAAINADETLTVKQKAQYLDNLCYAEVQVDHMKFMNYEALFATTEEKDKEFYQSYYDKLKALNITKLGNAYKSTVAQIFAELGIY